MVFTWRSPTTMSASPRRIGVTSLGMSAASYWLSASVLTITSAPSFSPASSPAWNAAARPLWLVRRTTWSTPFARATSTVRSVEPSSMISHSTVSKPGTWRGSRPRVTGSCSSSLKQGIWMISFMGWSRAVGPETSGPADRSASTPAELTHGSGRCGGGPPPNESLRNPDGGAYPQRPTCTHPPTPISAISPAGSGWPREGAAA